MSIKIELERGRIRLRAPHPVSGLKRVVPGAFFAKGRKEGQEHWSMPLSLDVCVLLREKFGDDLEIGAALWAWAAEEKRKAASMRELAGASDAKLEWVSKLAPRLAKAMKARKYQRVGARFVAEGHNVLIADQPGLGKTLECLAGITESRVDGPYLVICPKTAVETVWAREIPRWMDGQRVITVPDGKLARERVLKQALYQSDPRALKTTWVVVNPEMIRTRVYWECGECGEHTPRKHGKVSLACGHDTRLRNPDYVDHTFPQLFGLEWGAVVVDESDRALLRLSGNPTQTRQGAEMLPVRQGGLKIAATGTPTRGRPHLIWGQLNWLDPKAFPAFWNWAELYWEVTGNGYSNYVIGRLKNEEGLWRSLDKYVLRRTKAEVAPDLPAKTYIGTPLSTSDHPSAHGVWLEMDPVQAKAYDQMLETSVAELEDGSQVEAIGILAELMRLKQFAGCSGKMVEKTRKVKLKDGTTIQEPYLQFFPALPSNKFEYLVQLLDELGYPDAPSTKVVVVSQFTEVLELFARELPARLRALSVHSRSPLPPTMSPVLLTGNVTGNARKLAVEGMNLPVGEGAHIMMLNTKAGGVAITLDQADVMVVLDETWVPDDQEQVEDRIHRVSRPRPVFYHYLRSLDTVDHGIALTNAQREYATKRLLDGRRGVEYAKSVLSRTKELA